MCYFYNGGFDGPTKVLLRWIPPQGFLLRWWRPPYSRFFLNTTILLLLVLATVLCETNPFPTVDVQAVPNLPADSNDIKSPAHPSQISGTNSAELAEPAGNWRYLVGNSQPLGNLEDEFSKAILHQNSHTPLSTNPDLSATIFEALASCAETDQRCQYELAVHYFLGRPPLKNRNLPSALHLLWLAADGGSADAQYLLGILHQNIALLPRKPPLQVNPPISPASSSLRVHIDKNHTLAYFYQGRHVLEPWGDSRRLMSFWRHIRERVDDGSSLLDFVWDPLRKAAKWSIEIAGWFRRDGDKKQGEKRVTIAEAMDSLLTVPDYAANPADPLPFIYAASVAGHPGAAAAAAWRSQFASMEGSVGQQQLACSAATAQYLPIAKMTAGVYASGIPQAIELIRLHEAAPHISSSGGFIPKDGTDFTRLYADPEQLTMLLQEAGEGNHGVHVLLGRKYLFGVDGFPQDFSKARYHLLAASRSSKGEAKSLLGYIYALGLGVEPDLDEAAEWFFRSATENQDAIAFNGLGLVYFFGTSLVKPNPSLAFEMFAKSAKLDSPDGQLNLAALYLTGIGGHKSFVKALKWLTRAVRGGSSGAAYALGVMHLSGLGAVRECNLAVALLKLTTERGGFFAHALQKAYGAYEQHAYDEAAFQFLLLAEAGHEASQSNLAFLLDAGLTDIFFDGGIQRKRLHAQRFYEMAAAQGSLFAQLRLGDYAYYGYGARRRSAPQEYSESFVDENGGSFGGWLFRLNMWMDVGSRDFSEAAAHYRKVAESASWGPAQAARARYNLGTMHLFGLGVTQDMFLARNHFIRSLDEDDGAPTAPVYAGLAAVYLFDFFSRVGMTQILEALQEEPRIVALLVNMVAVLTLLAFRTTIQSLNNQGSFLEASFRAAEPRGQTEARQNEQLQPNNETRNSSPRSMDKVSHGGMQPANRETQQHHHVSENHEIASRPSVCRNSEEIVSVAHSDLPGATQQFKAETGGNSESPVTFFSHHGNAA